MKKALKIIVPLLLAVLIVASIGWYLFVYDRDFTRDMLLQQARTQDDAGNAKVASWLYNMAYAHSGNDEDVAIELASQYKADGNYTKAEQTLSSAIADGGTAELYIALCKTYVEQDKLLDAVNMLDTIADPDIKAELERRRPEAPAAEPDPGFYSQYITVTFAEAEGTLYYNTRGEYPSLTNPVYSEPITLPAGETNIYAVTVSNEGLVSPLTILGYTIGGVIEPVEFADSAMEAQIRSLLGAGEDDILYTDDLWAITEFTVPAEAEVLDDLAFLPYLESLSMSDKKLESLSMLSGLSYLNELTLTNCKFPSDDLTYLAQLPALEKLTLSNCGLSTIANLTTAQHLTCLDLSSNTLRNLEPLASMTGLTELYLQHNAVTSLADLASLVNLETLDVSYNSLTSLSQAASLEKLSWLDVSHNSIASLSGVENLSRLSHLAADYNKLADVSILKSCENLTELSISNNSLTDISALSALTKLQTLNFAKNAVTELPAWPSGSALYSIDGSNNQLESIDSLKNMSSLAYVYMDYNLLTSVDALANCSKLVMVNIFGNEVEDVSALTARNIIVNYDPT